MSQRKQPNITILIPSRDTLEARFAVCLAALVAYSCMRGLRINISNPRTHLIRARNNGLLKVLQDKECTHVLFIDSDQTFPADGLLRLLAHKKRIVSASSVTREPPIRFTALDTKENPIDFRQRKGLHEVRSNGTPFMLIKRDVFEKLEFPWFMFEYKDNHPANLISEDTYFCLKARDAGFKIWVDADLTNEIGHCGTREYTPADYSLDDE